MKRLKSFVGIILVIAIVCSLAACGNGKNENTVQDDSGTKGYLSQEYEEDQLGTPEKEINAQSVYRNLTYTPEMFYGDYRLLGGDDAIKQYCQDMDYIDFNDASYFNQEGF